MKPILTSCIEQIPLCAPVLVDHDPADAACACATGRLSAVPRPASAEDMESNRDFCCTLSLRAALERVAAQRSDGANFPPKTSPARPATRKSKTVQRVKKALRAKRGLVRSGRQPAALKPPRLFRLAALASETPAPYPLERSDFRATLAEALDGLGQQTEASEGYENKNHILGK